MQRFFDLWAWNGRLTRRGYILAGVALFVVKYALDHSVARLFGQPWNLLAYLSPRVDPRLHPGEHPLYWTALLLIALPFVIAGVSLSARRLRDIGAHPFWAGLFFMPYVHFAFFLALAIAPSSGEQASRPDRGVSAHRFEHPPRWFIGSIPRSPGVAFIAGTVLSLGLGLGCYLVTVGLTHSFGATLFIGLPFGMGFLPVYWIAYRMPLSAKGAIGYGLAPSLIALAL